VFVKFSDPAVTPPAATPSVRLAVMTSPNVATTDADDVYVVGAPAPFSSQFAVAVSHVPTASVFHT
jgi:hypothetical protein